MVKSCESTGESSRTMTNRSLLNCPRSGFATITRLPSHPRQGSRRRGASWTTIRALPHGPHPRSSPLASGLLPKSAKFVRCRSHRYTPTRPAECPQCHCKQVAEILYGVPHHSEALQAELDSGRICLGGSWAWDESPQWRCLSCKHEWGLTGYALALHEIEHREGQQK